MGASLPLVGAGEPVGEPERQLPLLRLHQPDELNPASIYVTSLRISHTYIQYFFPVPRPLCEF